MMTNPLRYTEEELVKELVLLEKHLKQEPYMEEDFCIDCIEKHLIGIEGLSEEGIGFADSKKKEKMFVGIANGANTLKRLIKTNPDYVELSRGVRQIRKKLSYCPTCAITPTNTKKRINSPKNLNSSYTKENNIKLKIDNKGGIQKMKADLKQLGVINAGQFAGNGVRILSDYIDTKVAATGWYKKPSTYIDIGGGLALQLLALFMIKNEDLRTLTIVAGSNMLSGRAITVVKEATGLRARVTPKPAARIARVPLRVTPTARASVTAAPSLVVVD